MDFYITEEQTAWIPSKFARQWNNVNLKVNGKWQHNWVVEGVFTTKDKDWVEEHEIDYRKQRKASDIWIGPISPFLVHVCILPMLCLAEVVLLILVEIRLYGPKKSLVVLHIHSPHKNPD